MKPKILIPLLALACLLAVPATAQVNYAVSGSTRARGRVEVEGTVISEILPRRL